MSIFWQQFLRIAVVVVTGAVLSGCGIIEKKSPLYTVNLEVWGTFDDSRDYENIFASYAKVNPLVGSITFRKFPIEDYERELLDALAAGTGPDIFMIQNAWLPDYQNKITPAPEYLIGKKAFMDTFVDVVARDAIGDDGAIYAVPLSVDALALYYNKDFFNAAGITRPPVTWEEFSAAVEKLTEIDQYGNIVRAGAAMGTGKNINRSADIVSVLFLQSGVPITENGAAKLTTTFTGTGNAVVNAGESALRFYTDFAAPSRSVYTWNRRQHYSLDAFTEGTVGMMLNYSWHYKTIKHKNEKLRFAVAPLPQLDTRAPRNIANYWMFVVAKNKAPVAKPGRKPVPNDVRVHEAWEFLKFLTMAHGKQFTIMHGITGQKKVVALPLDPAKEYITRTGKPAARRDLVEEQKSDPVLGAFAHGVLIAETYRRRSAAAVDAALVEMIEAVNTGQRTVRDALRAAEAQITKLLR